MRRNTWQDECYVCRKKVYLMERHMSNNRLYHRQCFRHHERASFVAADNRGLQLSESVVDMHDDVTSDGDCSHKAASVSVSGASVSAYSNTPCSDTPSVASASKITCTSPKTHSSVSSASCLPSLESSAAAATGKDASVKPSVGQHQVAVNNNAPGLSSQLDGAAVDITVQEHSASADVQTDLPGTVSRHSTVVASQSSTTPANMTQTQTEATSVMASEPKEGLVTNSACSVVQMKSTVNIDASEVSKQQQIKQNEVKSEATKETLLEKLAETFTVPISTSEHLSSPSSFAVTVTEHVADSVAKNRVICRRAPMVPKTRPLAPVAEDVIAPQPTSHHSSSLGICKAASANTAAVKLPSESVTPSVHGTSHTVMASSSSSESSRVLMHPVVKDTCRIVVRRPAPLPPSQTRQVTSANQQPTSATPSDSQHMAASISTTPEMTEVLQEALTAGLQSDVHVGQLLSKDGSSKHCDEPTASEASCDRPVPTPRRSQLPKVDIPSMDVEMCTASLSSTESPLIVTNDASVPPRSSPVPKPRKKFHASQESAEVSGEEKPDEVVKHSDIELSHGDGAYTVVSKSDNTVMRDSCMFAASGEEPGKQIQVTHIRSPQSATASSSSQLCEENKSLSLSPALPVKYPRSKKRAAPLPPTQERPVSPSVQSLKPEGNGGTKSQQVLVASQQQSLPAVGTSPRAADKCAEKSPTVNSEESSKPARKKISPGVKFTFEKDVFRPGKINAMEATSSAELLKPSRPAPPRPAGVAVTKRKVLLA